MYTTCTNRQTTMKPIIGNAMCNCHVLLNIIDGEIGISHHFYCLPGAKIGQAISPTMIVYPRHNCMLGLGLPLLAPAE